MNHKKSIVHFIELKDRYAIDARLLGRHIRIRMSDDCYMYLIIPSLVVRNGFPEIEIPGALEKYKADLDEWGCVKSYESIDNLDRMNVWIYAVLIECFCEDKNSLPNSSIIQAETKKILHSLQIINPNAIRIPSDGQENELCKVMSSTTNENGKALIEVKLPPFVLDNRGEKLSIIDIKKAFRNANNSVSAPYEMLNNARINFANHDTRATVLNCATAVEVMLKKEVLTYFSENNIPQELRDYVLKQSDGFDKLISLCKYLNINLTRMPNAKEFVMKIRNRVIHGGYVPSNEEAQKSYNITMEALKVMNAPMFESNS